MNTTSTPSLRLVFAGTPEFAASHLQALIDDRKHQLVAVYTQPDRPAGRGKKPQPSAVKQCALGADIPVFQPLNFREQSDRDILASHGADLMIVVAYGLILPQAVLDLPRLGCINVHGSLLPRWRGAAPIQRAIEAGDTETGVTIMQMEAGLDTGPMFTKILSPIHPDDTSASLYQRLAELGCGALLNTVSALAEDSAQSEIQDDKLSNYASKIDKSEAEICWQDSAELIERKIRAFSPSPICHTRFSLNSKDERIKIWRAQVEQGSGEPGQIIRADKSGITVACGQDALRILELQMPGGKVLAARDILNSRAEQFAPGTPLGIL
jgi:methionyl-tRNA formyltransferase